MREPKLSRRAAGAGGALRVGCRVAAELGTWTLAGADSATRFEATIVASAAYWLRQPQFDVVLVVGIDTWTWRGVTVRIEGRTVVATLDGRPEATRGGARSLGRVA